MGLDRIRSYGRLGRQGAVRAGGRDEPEIHLGRDEVVRAAPFGEIEIPDQERSSSRSSRRSVCRTPASSERIDSASCRFVFCSSATFSSIVSFVIRR